MASNEGGGNGFLGMIAGIAICAALFLGFVAYTGGFSGRDTAEITIEAPEVPSPS
jgi:hypothetical protein